MIGMLPILRWPWRRNRVAAGPVAVAEPLSMPEPPPAPVWTHRPPETFVWASNCGWCRKPIPADSPDPEHCSISCAANWLRETNGPTYGPPLPPIQGCDPPPAHGLRLIPECPPDPPWLAALTAWDRAKANRVADERKAA